MDQEATPTGCMVVNGEVITMSDEYKFKMWGGDEKSCRKTILTPTYGGPICAMEEVRGEHDRFMLYATQEKVVGLIQLPFDGNPQKCMGLIAHPGHISAMSMDFEGKFAFTCGGSDLTMNMWKLDTQRLAGANLYTSGIEPFVKVLDGGEDGDFYRDMKDQFYYAQIRSRGEDTTKARCLDGSMPVKELPDLMCALGYFPSKLEIDNMTNEVKYSKLAETGEFTTKLTFEELVKLYVNHRPVFAIGSPEIERSFHALKSDGPLPKATLIDLLTLRGEKMTVEEISQCVEVLTGQSLQELSDELDPEDLAAILCDEGFGDDLNEAQDGSL